jgi:hypothetical protein
MQSGAAWVVADMPWGLILMARGINNTEIQ